MRESVYLVQVITVVDEVSCFFAIEFHKVFTCYVKRFLYTFTNSDTWHNNDELRPAIKLVQFKHCLDIDICFTSSCFHFNIQLATAQFIYQITGHPDIVFRLNLMNIVQQVLPAEHNISIFVACMIIKINSLNFMQFSIFFYIGLAFIYNVFGKSLIRLTVENLNYILNGICLILLYFEF